MMPPRPPLKFDKLSHNVGQYIITLSCTCGHRHRASPRTLAAIAGWDARLEDVLKRMRCSQCGKRGACRASVVHETKRDV
jgi:hypothetical protein